MRPKWYLTEIKEKENKSWTDKERRTVLNLREKLQLSAGEIADVMEVTKIQVYNVTRLERKILKGCCYHCGRKLSEEEKKKFKNRTFILCLKCLRTLREYKRNLRVEALEKGLCGQCMRRKIVEGKTACKKCMSATHRRRYTKGLCGHCGKRPINKQRSISLCTKCLNKQKRIA